MRRSRAGRVEGESRYKLANSLQRTLLEGPPSLDSDFTPWLAMCDLPRIPIDVAEMDSIEESIDLNFDATPLPAQNIFAARWSLCIVGEDIFGHYCPI